MHFTRFWSIVEATHEISNPVTPQKLDHLIDVMQFRGGQHILDVGSGRGWMATRIAERTGAQLTCVEINPWFNTTARQRAQRAGVEDHITIVESDGRAVEYPTAHYDAALCLGASFAVGGLDPLLTMLRRTVKPGGLIAIGDIFRITDTLPPALAELEPLPDLAGLVDRISGQHAPIEMLVAQPDEWDRYETRKWRAGNAWIAANHDDPELAAFQERFTAMRTDYLRYERPYIGWAIVVARV
jgi:ubiquinone/menaquinone biosynthesis C-methylase UbiE